jgi:hypothetical protein
MEWEVTFSGTAEEWEAEQKLKLCLVRPSSRSTARCEMNKGHDADAPYAGTSPEAAEFLASFHAGRTTRGRWKFWPAVKPAEKS